MLDYNNLYKGTRYLFYVRKTQDSSITTFQANYEYVTKTTLAVSKYCKKGEIPDSASLCCMPSNWIIKIETLNGIDTNECIGIHSNDIIIDI